MDEFKFLNEMSQERQLTSVLNTNQYTEKFGLKLSSKDADLLVKERTDSLKNQERIEFGGGILPAIIFAFCDSPYIYQDNYVDTIGRLQDIFYLYKNESLDEATDEELLDYMKEQFNGICQGSLDYLEDTSLEDYARTIREGCHRFMGRNNEDEL